MMRNRNFVFIALFAGVFALGMAACGDSGSGVECGDGVCEGSETCDSCEADCGQCDPCNHDGVCDAGESCVLCGDDCCTTCDLPSMTGADNDFVVHQLHLPTTTAEAAANGVDIDGDGDIDNKLGQIIQLLANNGMDGDINEMINDEITAGDLLLAARVKESGAGDGVVAVQIFQGDIFDATPVFGGADNVLIPSTSPQNLFLCGDWDGGPDLETTPAQISLAFPLPDIGLLEVTLSAAQVRTVTDPDNDFYSTSSVTSSEMVDVMIGGGIAEDEIYGPGGLIEFLAGFISDLVAEGGSTADTIAQLFDGTCVAMADVPGCENVVAGEGECSDTDDPPIITVTELKCNALLNSALKPDVDSDGDGEDDLLSLGLRLRHATGATLHFQ